jgi:hypothetical protein
MGWRWHLENAFTLFVLLAVLPALGMFFVWLACRAAYVLWKAVW